jgi:hypothetical protein
MDPAVDVWEESEIVVSMDRPGVQEDQVAIEVDDGVLTISGASVSARPRSRRIATTGSGVSNVLPQRHAAPGDLRRRHRAKFR